MPILDPSPQQQGASQQQQELQEDDHEQQKRIGGGDNCGLGRKHDTSIMSSAAAPVLVALRRGKRLLTRKTRSARSQQTTATTPSSACDEILPLPAPMSFTKEVETKSDKTDTNVPQGDGTRKHTSMVRKLLKRAVPVRHHHRRRRRHQQQTHCPTVESSAIIDKAHLSCFNFVYANTDRATLGSSSNRKKLSRFGGVSLKRRMRSIAGTGTAASRIQYDGEPNDENGVLGASRIQYDGEPNDENEVLGTRLRFARNRYADDDHDDGSSSEERNVPLTRLAADTSRLLQLAAATDSDESSYSTENDSTISGSTRNSGFAMMSEKIVLLNSHPEPLNYCDDVCTSEEVKQPSTRGTHRIRSLEFYNPAESLKLHEMQAENGESQRHEKTLESLLHSAEVFDTQDPPPAPLPLLSDSSQEEDEHKSQLRSQQMSQLRSPPLEPPAGTPLPVSGFSPFYSAQRKNPEIKLTNHTESSQKIVNDLQRPLIDGRIMNKPFVILLPEDDSGSCSDDLDGDGSSADSSSSPKLYSPSVLRGKEQTEPEKNLGLRSKTSLDVFPGVSGDSIFRRPSLLPTQQRGALRPTPSKEEMSGNNPGMLLESLEDEVRDHQTSRKEDYSSGIQLYINAATRIDGSHSSSMTASVESAASADEDAFLPSHLEEHDLSSLESRDDNNENATTLGSIKSCLDQGSRINSEVSTKQETPMSNSVVERHTLKMKFRNSDFARALAIVCQGSDDLVGFRPDTIELRNSAGGGVIRNLCLLESGGFFVKLEGGRSHRCSALPFRLSERLEEVSMEQELVRLVTGPLDSYYAEFASGETWWGLPNDREGVLENILRLWNVACIAFGESVSCESSWIVVDKKGCAAWNDIPVRLECMLQRKGIINDALPTNQTSVTKTQGIAHVSLGTSDSYFVRFLDGTVDYLLPVAAATACQEVEMAKLALWNAWLHPSLPEYVVQTRPFAP